MCGIAGYYAFDGANQSKLKLVAALLGIKMESRGTHSWGTLAPETLINKGVGALTSGLIMPDVMPEVFVMHTRHATHGDLTEENAHPFKQGAVAGVHNGVLGNHEVLNSRYGRNFVVDSQHIFAHIDEGVNDLYDVEGYGAIVYSKDGKWFAGTFNGGELQTAVTDEGLIFASTMTSIMAACRYAGIKIIDWMDMADNQVWSLPDMKPQFPINAALTSLRWDDDKPSKKSLLGRILAENGVEVEEHDESSTGLECGHCYSPCLPELYYKNVEEVIVCADCARTAYAFLAPDEYTELESIVGVAACELCTGGAGKYFLKDEVCIVCQDCFETCFNTKGLTKVTSTLVH